MTDDEVRALARVEYATDTPDIQIDNNAKVSRGGDEGAFVQAWVWVNFITGETP